ncbi:MAG: helix-turn-helix domain-containing protein [Micromonosporaceae bacterium]
MTKPYDPLEEWLTQPGGLADRLRAARLRAGLTGGQLAERNGWQQPKVSKIENGKQAPSISDIEAWMATCGLGEPDASELVHRLQQVTARHRDWRRRMRQGQVSIQTSVNELFREATRCRDFATCFVPGLLQTAEYARVPLGQGVILHGASADELDEAVVTRMRRQRFLYDASKTFEFLLAEPVLRWLSCPPAVMLGQLDRLLAVVSGMSNIRFGILPTGLPITLSPQNSFSLVDDVAYVETFVGETVHYGDEAATYHRVMDRLWEDAVTGEQARKLIVSAAQALQELIAAESD